MLKKLPSAKKSACTGDFKEHLSQSSLYCKKPSKHSSGTTCTDPVSKPQEVQPAQGKVSSELRPGFSRLYSAGL